MDSDHEEGEILDQSEDEYSNISDEQLEDEDSQKKEEETGGDSEMASTDLTSKEEQRDGDKDNPEPVPEIEDDEIDTSTLYLRLIALQSMQLASQETEEAFTKEMQELIAEVDETERLQREKEGTVEVITIDDDDDGAQELSSVGMKSNAQIRRGLDSLPHSDSQGLNSILTSPEDIPLPCPPPIPKEQNDDFELIFSAPPPPPPPPPPPSIFPLASLTESSFPPLPLNCDRETSFSGTPPDRKREEDKSIEFVMCVKGENENSVILNQGLRFSTEMQENDSQSRYDYAPTKRYKNCSSSSSNGNDSKEREKRPENTRKRSSSGSDVKVKKQKTSEKAIHNEEDEDALREMLLGQISKSSITGTGKERNTKRAAERSRGKEINRQMKSFVGKTVPEKSSNIRKSPNHSNVVQASTQNNSSSRKERSSKSKEPTSKQTKSLTKEEKLKYFPNLIKRVVIPLDRTNSDSEDDENENVPNDGETSIFIAHLNSFLRESRLRADEAAKNQGSHNNFHFPQNLKERVSNLSLSDKRLLKSSSIAHLSEEKQMEYMHLKELIAIKEQKKKMRLKAGAPLPQKDNNSNTSTIKDSRHTASQGSHSDETDVLKMRNDLIKDLANKQQLKRSILTVDSSKKSTKDEVTQANKTVKVKSADLNAKESGSTSTTNVTSINIKNNLTVKVSGNKRNVEVESKETNIFPRTASNGTAKSSESHAKHPSSKMESVHGKGQKDPKIDSKKVQDKANILTVVSRKKVITANESKMVNNGTEGVRMPKEGTSQQEKSKLQKNMSCPDLSNVSDPSRKTPEEKKTPAIKKSQELTSQEQELKTARHMYLSCLNTYAAKISEYNEQQSELNQAIKTMETLMKSLASIKETVRLKRSEINSSVEAKKILSSEISSHLQKLSDFEQKCTTLGNEVHGETYALPVEGHDIIRKMESNVKSMEALTEDVKIRNQKESSAQKSNNCHSKVIPESQKRSKETRNIPTNASIGKELVSGKISSPITHLSDNTYVSALEHIQSQPTRSESKLDPNLEICYFGLAGKCKDENCKFQHI